MRVIYADLDNIGTLARKESLPESVCAIGYFDGFHTGHKQLLERALQDAASMHLQSAIMTFDPDPWTVFHSQGDMHHLLTLEDKIERAQSMGFDLFYVTVFSRAFAALQPEAFHQFVKDLNIARLICGFDYTYGIRGSGNAETLQQQNLFECRVIDQVCLDDQKISTSRIESLIRRGKMQEANRLLETIYSVAGTIVSGFQRGSTLLKTPTANLKWLPEYILPAKGVYAGLAAVDGRLYPAMINIGTNPTFGNEAVSMEANLLGASLDLYGRKARFFFAARLRPEMKFGGAEQLEEQLSKDRVHTIQILKKEMTALLQVSALWRFTPVFDILEK